MINLESTDSLTLGTSAVGAISAHVSWVDQSGTTFTPGRTNTASITTIATTTILSSPAASTLRNAKFISLFNTHASTANILTLRHTDGANPITLLTITLAAGESVSWTEGRGWTRFNSNGIPVILGNTGPVDVQTFSTAGSNTWTKPTAFVPTQVLVKIWGPGGGGGGGGAVAFATACKGGAGGGGGACAVKYFLASELAPTVVVTLGAGGSSGIGNLSAAGNAGGNGTVSTFGALLSAYGGGGGGGGQISGATTTSGGGGGTASAAATPTAGLPSGGFDGGGASGSTSGAAAIFTEFGGCSGIGGQSIGIGLSTLSLFGGSGGGNAGYRTASGQAIGPGLTTGAGGRFPGGSGITGTVPTAGGAGAAGNSIWGGSGGGAGGNSNNAAVNGGAGGAGGLGGGGGGGGGLTIVGNTGGAGGAGGAGYCVVISW